MNILYPDTSLLDTFMEGQGLHKKLRHNIKVVNGEVVFNRLRKDRKGKTIDTFSSANRGSENNFFAKKKQDE